MYHVFSHIMTFVLHQNAMRATVETHETSPTLPPIKVRISLGSEDLTIKVRVVMNDVNQLRVSFKFGVLETKKI